jgi:NADH-quinone oxidoreductase subunit N
MVGFTRTRRRSIEASFKYLVLAGVSTAFLLFGMALIYAETGSMEFGQILTQVKTTDLREGVLLVGVAMMLVAVGFKLALAPFHLWTPDVYEGAPAPVTAFVATVSKGAMTALLLRIYVIAGGVLPEALWSILALIAVVSMFVGNLLALLQANLKRVLAYSSIAHLGYLVVAFLAGGEYALTAVSYYLIAYMFTSLGTFGIIAVLSNWNEEAEMIQSYTGLYWRSPWIAGLFTTFLLSLAGIPLTAGFIGKFYIFAAGVDTGTWLLLIFLVINSAIGLFYYLRIVAAMYANAEPLDQLESAPQIALVGSLMLTLVGLLVLWLGILPNSLISLIQATVGNLLSAPTA